MPVWKNKGWKPDMRQCFSLKEPRWEDFVVELPRAIAGKSVLSLQHRWMLKADSGFGIDTLFTTGNSLLI